MKEDLDPISLNESDNTKADSKNKIIIPGIMDRFWASLADGFIINVLLFLGTFILTLINFNEFAFPIFNLLIILSIYYGYFVIQITGKDGATLGQSYCKYRLADYPSGKPASKLQICLWATYKLSPAIAFAFSDGWAVILIILLGLPVFIKPYRRTVYDRLAGLVMLNNQSIIHKK